MEEGVAQVMYVQVDLPCNMGRSGSPRLRSSVVLDCPEHPPVSDKEVTPAPFDPPHRGMQCDLALPCDRCLPRRLVARDETERDRLTAPAWTFELSRPQRRRVVTDQVNHCVCQMVGWVLDKGVTERPPRIQQQPEPSGELLKPAHDALRLSSAQSNGGSTSPRPTCRPITSHGSPSSSRSKMPCMRLIRVAAYSPFESAR